METINTFICSWFPLRETQFETCKSFFFLLKNVENVKEKRNRLTQILFRKMVKQLANIFTSNLDFIHGLRHKKTTLNE